MKKRIGIFGGTFNPPHCGHVASAQKFAEQMQLDELIIMPSFIPPHKEYDSDVSCEERLDMCRLAFADVDSARVSDLEIRRGGKSYTYVTLEQLYSDDAELFFLCGTDMILSMDTWKNPDVIFKLSTICYIRREKDPVNDTLIDEKCDQYRMEYGARIFRIDTDVIDVSSSEIRSLKADMTKYLPSSVLRYIKERGLYK